MTEAMTEMTTLTKSRSKKIPKSPRYAMVQRVVTRVLLRYADNQIPVSLSYITDTFNNIELRSYGWYQKSMGVERKYIVDKLTKSEDGGLLKLSDDTGKEEYFILYDESKKVGRKRFTIAHELGHYFLKHHQLIEGEIIARGEITDKEYDVLEKEANYFARLLLVPLPLLPYISINWGTINNDHIINIFNVTYTVSRNVLGHINKLKSRGGTLINVDIVDKYKNSLNKYINIHICNNCHTEFIKEDPKYCPICKSNNIRKITSEYYEIYSDFERSDYVIYDGIEVDENSKAIVCPVCGNEEPEDGEYCSICGTYLINKCTNDDYPGRNEFDGPICGAHLPGNARYCTYCGEKSTFLENKILKPWEKEIESNNDEVAASTYFDDEDLPF